MVIMCIDEDGCVAIVDCRKVEKGRKKGRLMILRNVGMEWVSFVLCLLLFLLGCGWD